MSAHKVLITGVYGLIGNIVYRHLSRQPESYTVYGLARRRRASERLKEEDLAEIPDDRFVLADLSDPDAVREAVRGMETVVHMAADPSGSGGWESVRDNNVHGAYHLFEACREAGVKRVLYASSIMVSWGYSADEPYRSIFEGRRDDVPETLPPITHAMPVRPTTLYAASKLWGESLARMYAEVHNMSCICLRIGWVLGEDRPRESRLGGDWCSHRDIAQLVERCIAAPDTLRFDLFYGVSGNRFRFVDIDHPRDVVGYVPQARAEEFLGEHTELG